MVCVCVCVCVRGKKFWTATSKSLISIAHYLKFVMIVVVVVCVVASASV